MLIDPEFDDDPGYDWEREYAQAEHDAQLAELDAEQYAEAQQGDAWSGGFAENH